MISFLLIPLFSLFATLLHAASIFAAPATSSPVASSTPGLNSHATANSNHNNHTATDPTAIRHSSAQISAFLRAHNTVRAQHHAKPLKWSSSLAAMAEQWADACNFRHTGGVLSDEPYGENIVAATGNFPVKDAVATFVKDASQYNPLNPVYSHFTQVVWKSTTDLGCAASTCNDIFPGHGPATLYVCFYSPPGNIIGEIAQNVEV